MSKCMHTSTSKVHACTCTHSYVYKLEYMCFNTPMHKRKHTCARMIVLESTIPYLQNCFTISLLQRLYMYVCMHVYKYIYIHIYTYIYTYICICIYVRMYVCICIYLRMYACMYVCMHMRVYIQVCVCVCGWVGVYISICIYNVFYAYVFLSSYVLNKLAMYIHAYRCGP
jgi:hypothetical protein